MAHIKDQLIAHREERGELADDLVRDDVPWDYVLRDLPLNAQPGSMVTGLSARTEFRDEREG